MRHTALFLLVLLAGCPPSAIGEFPDFITSNDDYFITRIGSIPAIEGEQFELSVGGLVDTPSTFTLDELQALPQQEITLTVECIGNSVDGALVSTAVWGGFDLYELLSSLGISDDATGVRYDADDGYYASHTMDQLRDNGLIGALTMNGVPIPAEHGYPLRILNPGYHGVKQPGWVTSIELIDMDVNDYWEDRNWDCSPPMAADTHFFFPQQSARVTTGEPLLVGGAAFGGTRIETVEISIDDGGTWLEAEIIEQMDLDDVWVFWQVEIEPDVPGELEIVSRATDQYGQTQPEADPDRYDGNNERPSITVVVKD
jgi:DMSO/TMAO reductase YedYZ molybdopterin-dependent catalytic subunit